jgi:hypothetical protein
VISCVTHRHCFERLTENEPPSISVKSRQV